MKRTGILLLVSGLYVGASAQTDPCSLLPDPGPCEAAIPAWYFDQEFQTCTQFTWGGCGGVVPFETLEECESAACGDGTGSLSDLCDSIAVTPLVLGDAALGHLEVEVNADYETDYWFGYAGFALFDEDGALLAAENPSTAPNAFGFDGSLGPHSRFLEYQPGVDLSLWTPPLELELRLYEGWMAGSVIERCAWTWTDITVPMGLGNGATPGFDDDEGPTWYDALGRPTTPIAGRWMILRKNGTAKPVVISE